MEPYDKELDAFENAIRGRRPCEVKMQDEIEMEERVDEIQQRKLKRQMKMAKRNNRKNKRTFVRGQANE